MSTPPLDAQKLHAMSQHVNKHGDGPTRDNWAILRDAYAELAGLNKPEPVVHSASSGHPGKAGWVGEKSQTTEQELDRTAVLVPAERPEQSVEPTEHVNHPGKHRR